MNDITHIIQLNKQKPYEVILLKKIPFSVIEGCVWVDQDITKIKPRFLCENLQKYRKFLKNNKN